MAIPSVDYLYHGSVHVNQGTVGVSQGTVVVSSLGTAGFTAGTVGVSSGTILANNPAGSGSAIIQVGTCTVADTEYTVVVSANTKRLEFQCRSESTLRFAFTTNKVATPTEPYMTLKAGDYFSSGDVLIAAGTLYLASDTAGDVYEVLCWT